METLLFGTKDKHIPQQVAQQYEARQTNSASKRFFQELLDRLFNQIVSEACSNKDDINILDVATGTGKIPLILANGQRKIFGVDISWEMIKIAREKVKQANLKNIYFQVGNSLSLPFSNSSFDVITCVAFLVPSQNTCGVLLFKRCMGY
jgi:ubiquinone/menaquinone biosynthesis C-methylase UbiE